jgi:hypothetical protein
LVWAGCKGPTRPAGGYPQAGRSRIEGEGEIEELTWRGGGQEVKEVAMPWIIRIFAFIAAPIAALFVARDTLNFTILQTMITLVLIVVALILVAVWPRRSKPD